MVIFEEEPRELDLCLTTRGCGDRKEKNKHVLLCLSAGHTIELNTMLK